MADTSLVAAKVVQSIASRLRPRLTNWFLRWAAPFAADQVIIRLEQIPGIYIHYDPGIYELILVFWIRNLTPYKIEFYGYECDIVVSSSPFFHVKESRYFILEHNEREKVVLRHQLALSEIKRSEARASGGEVFNAQYTFNFSVNTRFGPQVIQPDSLHSAMIISKYGQPSA